MNQSTKRVYFFLMAGLLLLASCAPAPAPAPTQDPAVVQQQIEEAVALTIAAKEAEAEQALLDQPTNTPLPTQTETGPASPTPLLPTATPFVVVPPTLTPAPANGGGGGSGVAPKPLEYDCTSRDRRPYDNTVFKSKNEFDIKWTIVNTGTKSWPAGFDVKYYSGEKMSPTTVVELPAMAPGDTYEVILDAVAPKKEGFYVMTYIVEGKLCFPYVAIIVEN